MTDRGSRMRLIGVKKTPSGPAGTRVCPFDVNQAKIRRPCCFLLHGRGRIQHFQEITTQKNSVDALEQKDYCAAAMTDAYTTRRNNETRWGKKKLGKTSDFGGGVPDAKDGYSIWVENGVVCTAPTVDRSSAATPTITAVTAVASATARAVRICCRLHPLVRLIPLELVR